MLALIYAEQNKQNKEPIRRKMLRHLTFEDFERLKGYMINFYFARL